MNTSDTNFELGHVRFYSVLDEWKRLMPEHQWIVRLGTELIEQVDPTFANSVFPAIGLLDIESWQVMRRNLAERYRAWDKEKNRGSHQFLDLLNEAIAYQHLLSLGFSGVKLQPRLTRKNVKSPDIGFFSKDREYRCEVKSIGESDENRRLFEQRIGFDPRIYTELTFGFFSKLAATIEVARNQIAQCGFEGIVYVILTFDDFTGRYASTYRAQIEAFLDEHRLRENLIVRFGRNSFMQPIVRVTFLQ